MKRQTKKSLIKSGDNKIYVEIEYPEKLPASAVIIAHGLRSYFPGFLNNFAKKLRDSGYITVKFHFVGTGKSTGKFEDKTAIEMLNNYSDVLEFIKKEPDVLDIAVIGRSNAGSTVVAHGPDSRIKAYALLAPPCFLGVVMEKFVKSATIKGKFFYHSSFKRPHTKGEGRLPIDFVENSLLYDQLIAEKVGKMKNVILFQGTNDESVRIEEGHFKFWKKMLPKPNKFVVIENVKHSFPGKHNYVFDETIKWFKKFLDNS